MALLAEADVTAALVRHARASNRIRLEIDTLIGAPALGRAIETGIGKRPGVVRVEASPRSGRVLIVLAPGAPMIAELAALAHRAARRAATPPDALAIPVLANAHALAVEEVVERLRSSPRDGLAAGEARRRLEAAGPNVIADGAAPSRLALLAGQVANLPNALLLGSAAIATILGDLLDAGTIVTVIGLNAAIGYRMERLNERLLASWRRAEVGTAEVIRGGVLATVHASELVIGDVLVIRAGNIVPADARLVDAHRLATDEAALTGESEPVDKATDAAPPHAGLAERTSMIYRGTAIAAGHGRAIVTAIGAATELARVQRLAAEARQPKGRLQRRLDALASRLAWSSLAASGIAAVASLAWRRPLVDVVRDTVALGVAAIPEGMPMTATAALVHAMARMRERGIIVRRLGITESLGAVTVACADKTGTLTEGTMQLEAAWIAGFRVPGDALRAANSTPIEGPVAALLAAALLNSDLEYQRDGNGNLQLAGSSTERALVFAAHQSGLDPRVLRQRFPRHHLIERTDETRYVITQHDAPDGSRLDLVKGAPEQVVELCTPEDAAAVLAENERLASAGLRVLAVGCRADDRPWRLIGLVALRDPLRPGSAEAIREAERAGIRTVVLTGDQRATAAAIARDVGLRGDVLDGSELEALLAAPDAAARLRRIAAIARVTPADKMAVVRALRAAGEVVLMAGDGINDAPALSAADVGIAVGARSTDLARQTADVVLEHEDLRSILAAVAEGRIVQDNLRRAIRFQIAGNLGELLLVVGAATAGRSLISPLGLLWINLLTDTLPGPALALEPGDPRVLDRPPAPPNARVLSRRDWERVARDGAALAGVAAGAALAGGGLSAFAAIGAVQFGYAAACRAPTAHGEGRRFALLVGGSAAAHLAAIAAPAMRGVLRISGGVSVAAGSFAVALAAPLYVAWRRRAQFEITRINQETRS